MSDPICTKCKIELKPCQAYEYRGAIACADCFDDVIEGRDYQRQEIMAEEHAKTECFRGLDLSPDTTLGKANREILKAQIEIAGKESGRLKAYEGRD